MKVAQPDVCPRTHFPRGECRCGDHAQASGTLAEFHPMLAAAGMIEPEFVAVVVGWANQAEMEWAGMVPLRALDSAVPVAWVPPSDLLCPLPTQQPIMEMRLRWRWT